MDEHDDEAEEERDYRMLSSRQMDAMTTMLAAGHSPAVVARALYKDPAMIAETWQMILDQDEYHEDMYLYENRARIIRARHADGASKAELAREYRLSYSTIDKIIRNITWRTP